ncbi:hypothetical protein GYMLUDRAFT_46601 [Collybiopsis luxurians FD-317 M1]|uniref:Uncharacterized protein n=1 Tax=Collybiopsis luxurians FD-317 M1 TaxID=944289 RepID=A0A0D0CFY2_9AGAR|nr:hypothetical protein GYMLUDRAFT_46601 [Collybiopsis luxurians FD-317 M1]
MWVRNDVDSVIVRVACPLRFFAYPVLKAPRLFSSDRYHLYKYPNYDLESNVEIVRKLAETCPSLERITFETTQIVLMRAIVRQGEKTYEYPAV